MKSIYGLVTMVAVASMLNACGAAPKGEEEPLAEGMGAIVASVPIVPSSVRCIEVNTSDYRVYNVRTDVTPGQSAHIRLAPLSPGYVYLYGTAYSSSCSNIYSYDAGSTATWQADYTSINVQAGTTTNTTMVFHKLADLNVEVQFQDPCVCTDGICTTIPQSGGDPQDCTPPGPSYDGGSVSDVLVETSDAGVP